jgi:hypothetical protein
MSDQDHDWQPRNSEVLVQTCTRCGMLKIVRKKRADGTVEFTYHQVLNGKYPCGSEIKK